jgi:hypothetical protein
MTAAYVLAGELGKPRRPLTTTSEFRGLSSNQSKQVPLVRFAPRTRWGLLLRNQIIKASAISGVARLAFGRDIMDTLPVPE